MHNVTSGKEAVSQMIKGIKIVTDAIRPTYGNNGTNVALEADRYPFHKVANDAQTIIQAIEVEQPVQKIAVGFLKELSDKQNAMSGDGRKTTCIIADVILENGFKSELKGMNLKRELDALIPIIEAEIDKLKSDITVEDIHKVAAIAGEDEYMGVIIGMIYKKIGADGVISVEGSGNEKDDIKYIDGVRFHNAGMLSPLMAHHKDADKHGDVGSTKDSDGMETMGGKKLTTATYENPLILITRQKMERLEHIDTVLSIMEQQGKKDLVIFTDDMDAKIAGIILETHKQGIFNICVIKAPSVFRNELFDDFSKVTGATVISDLNGIDLADLPIDLGFMGTCDKIIVGKEETIVIGIQDISEHLEELRAENSELANMRIKWLNTQTAILKLGANNESELSYKRLKCEDAVNASRLALLGGVINGGGTTLYEVGYKLPDTPAGKILWHALKAPLEQIMENSGLLSRPDTFGPNVLDSAMVVKNAIRNAVSLSSIVLTTGAVITLPKKEVAEIPTKPFGL